MEIREAGNHSQRQICPLNTDGPRVIWINVNKRIPPITLKELSRAVNKVTRKQSTDAQEVSLMMLSFLPQIYLSSIWNIFKKSVELGTGPLLWKAAKMKLLSKKEAICRMKDTRSISPLDIFLKLLERPFLSRLMKLVQNRGILHDSQSG